MEIAYHTISRNQGFKDMKISVQKTYFPSRCDVSDATRFNRRDVVVVSVI